MSNPGWVERFNPAHPDQIVGMVRVCSPEAVDGVIRKAEEAQRSWAERPTWARAELLLSAASAVQPRVEFWAEVLARELGKPLPEARGEIGFALATLRWFAERAVAVLADEETDDELGRLVLRKRPYGVVAAVTPWNAPIILSMLKVAPALLAGNSVVVKPSPLAPIAVDGLYDELGQHLPEGLLTVIHGDASTGEALVGHPRVHKVAFTGGNEVGRHIAAATAGVLTSTVLELGGNDAAIFLPDVDLSDADMARAVVASFATAGQVCMAAKRLYVHSSQVEEFVAAYVAAAARALVLGDPMVAGTTVGPVITREAQQRLLGLLADCESRGARLVPLGTVPDAAVVEGGWFVRPTLVLGLDDSSPLVRDEQFGPLVPLLTYDDIDEVVMRANAGDLGLGASVWSSDEEQAFAVARRLDAGFTFVNTHNRTGMSLRAPFGGVKRSGYGREYGEEGLLEYVQTCAINAPASFRPGADPVDGAGPGAYPTDPHFTRDTPS